MSPRHCPYIVPVNVPPFKLMPNCLLSIELLPVPRIYPFRYSAMFSNPHSFGWIPSELIMFSKDRMFSAPGTNTKG